MHVNRKIFKPSSRKCNKIDVLFPETVKYSKTWVIVRINWWIHSLAFDGSSDDRDDDDNDIWMITEMKIIAKISTRIMKYEPLDTQKIVSYKLKFLRSYK